ncbi:unnamed protein product [Leuciscus chuanchicus]
MKEVGQCAEHQRVVFTSDSHGGNAQYLTIAHSPLKGREITMVVFETSEKRGCYHDGVVMKELSTASDGWRALMTETTHPESVSQQRLRGPRAALTSHNRRLAQGRVQTQVRLGSPRPISDSGGVHGKRAALGIQQCSSHSLVFQWPLQLMYQASRTSGPRGPRSPPVPTPTTQTRTRAPTTAISPQPVLGPNGSDW